MIRLHLPAAAVLFTIAFGAAPPQAAQAESNHRDKVSFEIGPVPSWVKRVASPVVQPAEQGPNAGTVYLLVDRQENAEKNSYFYHDVLRVTSENGLESASSVSTSFKPHFEKLILHTIQLTRNGVTSNRLDRARIIMQPREKDPDRSLYDLSYTAQTVLEDVRVGDVIEFACTTEGANPLKRGKYSSVYSMQWEVPIARNMLRVIYPGNRKLLTAARNGAPQPTVRMANGFAELSCEATGVTPRKVEDDVPEDYNPKARLEITEFSDWAELVRWAIPLFQTAPPRGAEFQAEVSKLRAITDPEQRVVTALQFVQEEIRYISLRSWVGAHPLTSPDEVVRRRFGDDSDKALLLVSLLGSSGIDAAPVLVSDTYRGGVHELLPSPDVLDHTIVQVRIGPHTHWIDPSRGHQNGPLSQIYVANYGYGLVLRPESRELTAFLAPRESWSIKKVTENYRIAPPDKVSELEVTSDYHGLDADRMRANFKEHTREEIQKNYLEYYEHKFPGAKVQKLVWYEELPGEDACRVTESYTLGNIWQLSDAKDRYLVSIQPGEISSAIGSTTSPEREDPLSLDYPKVVIEQLNLQMFEDWPFSSKATDVTNDFFRIHEEPITTSSLLRFDYTFQSLKDRVELKELAKFNETVSDAKDALGYTLRYQTPEQQQKAQKQKTLNWAVAAAALSFLAAAIFVAWWYFRTSRLPHPRPPPLAATAGLSGIGGWLVLVLIGLALRPFSFIKTGFDLYPVMFNTETWRSLTDPIESTYHAWWAPALLFELFFMVAGFVFGVLLVALFLTKRAAWPRAFALFIIVNLAGTALDILFMHQIPAAAGEIRGSIGALIGMTISAAIWIPYAFRSKRVKSTFRY